MMIPLPRDDFDWNTYDSKKNPVSCHVECIYSEKNGGWSEPRAVASPWLQVHGLAPGLHYGQQAFEGIQARRTAENDILIFRPSAHAARLARSASAVSMPAVPDGLFRDAVHMAVALNAKHVPPHDFRGSLYIRPFQFGSSAQIGLDPPDEFVFCVFVQPHIAFHGHGALRAKVADRFDRAATRGTGNVKVGGNYAPVIRWSMDARREGWGVLLHLDSKTQTYLDEFSTSAFIGIKKPAAVVDGGSSGTAPTLVIASSSAALQSITAESVAQLATSFGWIVEKRQVKLDELADLQEVMAAGTASGIVPVSCIYHESADRTFHYSPDGECYLKLRVALEAICRGEAVDTFVWCEKLRYGEFEKVTVN